MDENNNMNQGVNLNKDASQPDYTQNYSQPDYSQQNFQQPNYQQYPNGQYPGGGAPLKSKITAGLLGIFLGGWGVHRFYLGYTKMGIIQIIVTLVTCGVGALWGEVEGILILCGTQITTDANGNPLSN